MGEVKKKKVLIVEDHPIVCKGLAQLINKQTDLTVCDVALNAQKVLESIKTNQPDLVTLDISLQDSSGLELIKDIATLYPSLPVLVISMFDESVYAERSIKAGAKGYIMKQSITKQLLKAIYQVLSGKIYLSEEMSSKLLDKSIHKGDGTASVMDLLSDRELEVFLLIGKGFTTEEIANKTNLGIKTIETYKSKIKEKLNLKNFTQLIKYAVEWSMLNTR